MMHPEWSFLADLFFPPCCPFCGKVIRHGEETCPSCADLQPKLMKKALPLKNGGAPFCYAIYVYQGRVRDAILRMKFADEPSVAPFFGRKLAQQLPTEVQPDVVTAVPMSRLHKRKRGYNQSERIARAAAAELGLPYRTLLYKAKKNRTQHRLSAVERFRNVQGVFAAKPAAKQKRILLIDDIATTGATLAECTRVLLREGAQSVLCAAVALAPELDR